jgi:hypothetical protein
MSKSNHEHINKAAGNTGNVTTMLNHAVEHTKLRIREALQLYETMHRESGQAASTLMHILPLMMEPDEARRLVAKVNRGDRLQTAKLKQAMGPALRAMCGAYNGYYCLNLSQESSILCLRRLIDIGTTWCNTQAAKSIIGGHGRIGDTSQKVRTHVHTYIRTYEYAKRRTCIYSAAAL